MRTLLFTVTTTLALTAAAQGPMVALDIDFPTAQTQGTPKDLDLPNTEPFVPGKKPRPLRVSKDATLVSRGKPVTYSGGQAMLGKLEEITDGDKEAPSRVELGAGKEWITIDLEDAYVIEAIAVWHAHHEYMIFFDVTVQASNDPDFVTGVVTLFNNDKDNSLGLGVGRGRQYVETNFGKQIPGKGVKARYIRLWSDGSTYTSINLYTEVEVYATPVK